LLEFDGTSWSVHLAKCCFDAIYLFWVGSGLRIFSDTTSCKKSWGSFLCHDFSNLYVAHFLHKLGRADMGGHLAKISCVFSNEADNGIEFDHLSGAFLVSFNLYSTSSHLHAAFPVHETWTPYERSGK
jgi:hypothetical protein